MTDVVLVNSAKNTLTDTIEVFYTSPLADKGTIITAYVASNNSGVNASYKAYIFDATGTPLEALTPTQVVVRKKIDLGPAVINQLIPAGGTLRMESSALNSIVFRVSGVALS